MLTLAEWHFSLPSLYKICLNVTYLFSLYIKLCQGVVYLPQLTLNLVEWYFFFPLDIEA